MLHAIVNYHTPNSKLKENADLLQDIGTREVIVSEEKGLTTRLAFLIVQS